MDSQRETAIRTLGGIIRSVRVAMLTTLCPDGTLHSRPMVTVDRDFDGDLWFYTHADAPKVDELEQHHEVSATYVDPQGQRYAAVSGEAAVVRQRQKIETMWNPVYQQWIPDGLDDPRLVMLRVRVHRAEYWDQTSQGVGRSLRTLFSGTAPPTAHGEIAWSGEEQSAVVASQKATAEERPNPSAEPIEPVGGADT